MAPCVVTLAVRETAEFPAVPELTYPSVTEGVTDTVLLSVMLLVFDVTDAPVPEMVAGAVTLRNIYLSAILIYHIIDHYILCHNNLLMILLICSHSK